MLRLEWNALRVGDPVLAHATVADLRLVPGVVADVAAAGVLLQRPIGGGETADQGRRSFTARLGPLPSQSARGGSVVVASVL